MEWVTVSEQMGEVGEGIMNWGRALKCTVVSEEMNGI